MNLERQTCNDIGIEVSLTGSYKDVQENIKAIDAVSTQDVIGVSAFYELFYCSLYSLSKLFLLLDRH